MCSNRRYRCRLNIPPGIDSRWRLLLTFLHYIAVLPFTALSGPKWTSASHTVHMDTFPFESGGAQEYMEI